MGANRELKASIRTNFVFISVLLGMLALGLYFSPFVASLISEPATSLWHTELQSTQKNYSWFNNATINCDNSLDNVNTTNFNVSVQNIANILYTAEFFGLGAGYNFTILTNNTSIVYTGTNFTIGFNFSGINFNNSLNITNVSVFYINSTNSTDVNKTLNLTLRNTDWMCIDTIAPNVNITKPTEINLTNNTVRFTNVTLWAGDTKPIKNVLIEVRFGHNGTLTNYTMAQLNSTNSDRSTFWTFNISSIDDSKISWRVIVNDTGAMVNSSERINKTFDATKPSVTASASPASSSLGGAFDINCIYSDDSTVGSGLNTKTATVTEQGASGVSVSTDGSSIKYNPTRVGTHTLSCSATDFAGNIQTTTATFSTTQSSGGGTSSGGSTAGSTKVKESGQFSAGSLEAGKEKVLALTNKVASEVSLTPKENIADPVTFTAEKASLPSDAPSLTNIVFTGKFTLTNLPNDKLEKAKVKVEVALTSLPSGVEADKAEFTFHRYDETNKKWVDLVTKATKTGDKFVVEFETDHFSLFTLTVAQKTSPPEAKKPSIKIESATVTGKNVGVKVSVQNFNIVDKAGQANVEGEGHVHFFLDDQYVSVSGTSHTFENVAPGTHTVKAELHNNDHSAVSTEAATTNITVEGKKTEPPPAPTPSPGVNPLLVGGIVVVVIVVLALGYFLMRKK